MDANQSIKSSLIHNGLSAEKEEAVRKFYQNFLRIMGSASEYGLDFQFVFQMTVKSSGEEMPSVILDASATDLIGPDMQTLHERLEEAWQEGATQGVRDMEHKLQELEEKHAKALAAAAALHKREMTERDKRYADALAPLLGISDKMRAECEKKCHDADRKGYAMGYAFADQKWNPVYKAVCEELELVRKEGDNHQDAYIRLLKERDELILVQADLRQELDEKLEAAQKELSGWYERCVGAQTAAERLKAENKVLLQKAEEDKQMVQRHLKEIAKENDEATAWEVGRWREENKALKEKHDALLDLVGPTITHMKSNPELFGGEAKGSSSPRPTQWRAVSEEETERAEKFLKGLEAKGTSSPRPPAILRLPQVKEEEGGEKILKAFVRPVFRHSAVVESAPKEVRPLPGLVEAEPSTEGLCRAWRGCDEDEDQPTVCGATGCIDCPPAEAAKPKPNYNHPNWPSPMTKRFAKHLAKHSGLRSPWHSHDPKTIKTHEDALEYIAKRVNISVENLLGWTMKQYQTTYDPWTLVEGPNKFHTGTAPTTWWC